MEECIYEENIYQNKDGSYSLRVESFGWDNYNDCAEYGEIEIKYCPFCGREL